MNYAEDVPYFSPDAQRTSDARFQGQFERLQKEQTRLADIISQLEERLAPVLRQHGTDERDSVPHEAPHSQLEGMCQSYGQQITRLAELNARITL